MEVRSDIDAQIVRYSRFLEAKDKSNHPVAVFLYVFFIETGVEQFSSSTSVFLKEWFQMVLTPCDSRCSALNVKVMEISNKRG